MDKKILAAALSSLLLTAAPAFAEGSDETSLTFTYDDSRVYASYDGDIDENTDFYIAVYDEGRLIAMDKPDREELPLDNYGIWIDDEYHDPKNLTMKGFLWSAGTLTPVADADEAVKIDTYTGIFTGMYKDPEKDFASVEIINENGEIITYECYDSEEESNFSSTALWSPMYNGETITKADLAPRFVDMTIQYRIYDGKIKFCGIPRGYGYDNSIFREFRQTFGNYEVDPDAEILYLGDYINNTDGKIYKVGIDAFEDYVEYNVRLFNYKRDGYGLCIVYDGLSNVNRMTNVAVVQSESYDDGEYISYDVIKEGAEDKVSFKKSDLCEFNKGDIIVYADCLGDYARDVHLVMASKDSYSDAVSEAENSFSASVKTIDENNKWNFEKGAIAAEAYFGPVYRKSGDNIEIITGKTDGISSVPEDIKAFNISGANTYLYDYNSGQITRTPAVSEISKTAYSEIQNSDGSIDFSAGIGNSPYLAFLKTVDGRVTDMVLFKAPYEGAYSGAEAEVEFSSDDVSAAEAYSYSMYSNGIISVNKDGEKISCLLEKNPELFVNDIQLEASDAVFTKYILENPGESIKLCDTDSNGLFDEIYTEFYETGRVTEVSDKGIVFENSTGIYGIIPANYKSAVFERNGAEISFNEISVGEIIRIAYDFEWYDLYDSEFVEVKASDRKLTGVIESVNGRGVTIDGNAYTVNPEFINIDYITAGEEYTFCIDALGTICDAENTGLSKALGIMTGISPSENGGAIISFVNTDGKNMTAEAFSHTDENGFYMQASGIDEYSGETITSGDIISHIEDMVFEYSVYDGKIIYRGKSEPRGGYLRYYAYEKRMGIYDMNDTDISLINFSEYDKCGEADKLRLDFLNNYSRYDAYFYDYSVKGNGAYKLCVFPKDTYEIRPETPIAVVQSAPKQIEENGQTYYEFTAAAYKCEGVVVRTESEDAASLKEGDIIIYTLNADDIAINLNVVLRSDPDYDSFADSALSSFSKLINTVDENGVWNWSDETEQVNVYVGPVYRKAANYIEIFVNASEGKSNEYSDVECFDLYEAATYIYAYSNAPRFRVTAGPLPNTSKNMYSACIDYDGNISWDDVREYDVRPNFAFIKETDGDVTDVVLFESN